MVRTNTVHLKTIDAVAYRQKLSSGGSGVVIIRNGTKQPGIASISKTSGKAIVAKNTQKELYPKQAFDEAIELTSGMPYKKQGTPKVKGTSVELGDKLEKPVPDEVAVNSDDYKKIVARYTDKKGKLSYDLINKDMIKFAHSSSVVRTMINDRADIDTIKQYVVCTKFCNITDNQYLTTLEINKMVDLLDEVSPKGVLTEFTEELRKMLAK